MWQDYAACSEQRPRTVSKRRVFNLHPIEYRKIQVAERFGLVRKERLCSPWHTAILPTCQNDGQIIGIVLIAIRHSGSERQQAIIQ